VLTDGTRVLLGKRATNRSFYPGVWDVIGGHVRAGESIEGALLREVAEEVGVVPSEYELVGVLEEPHPEENGPGQYHFFVVRKWEGSGPSLQNDEHSELGWFSVEEACQLDLADPSYRTLFTAMGRLLARGAA
jgi:8-oxo-dGTP diphosphatase